MDVALMSMSMANASLQQMASLAMTKQAMNMAEVEMQGIVDMAQTAVPPSPPHLGQNIDVFA